MQSFFPRCGLRHLAALAAMALLACAGCKRVQPLDTKPLDLAGVGFQAIQELKALNVTPDEVAGVARVREAGISDAGCLELVRIAHSRNLPFTDAERVLALGRAGSSENTVLELARMNQLASWAGEAQALRLTGLSDDVILAVARRRAAGQPTMSSAAIAKMKNAGFTEAQILEALGRGFTDKDAEEAVAARRRAETPQGFVRQRGRRRR